MRTCCPGVLAYQTPVAVSSYIMAQQAGADGQLAGQLVVFSSVAFDIYVVCDDIHIADDGAPCGFSTIKVITLFQKKSS